MRHISHNMLYGSAADNWLTACGMDVSPTWDSTIRSDPPPLVHPNEWKTFMLNERCSQCTNLMEEVVRHSGTADAIKKITWHGDIDRLRNYISHARSSLAFAELALREIEQPGRKESHNVG